MKKYLLGTVAFMVLVGVGGASAADMPVKAPPPPPLDWSWAGWYVGTFTGGAWGTTHFSDPFGSSIYGDNVRTPGALFGGDIGFNWQAPNSPWVFGVEADATAYASWPGGTNTCLAFSGVYISPNCRVRPDATATFTGRVGHTFGPQGRTLLYVKGGLAWADDHINIAVGTPNGVAGATVLPGTATGTTLSKFGGTVGAGVEEALTPAFSVKLEYKYLGFGGSSVATPASFLVSGAPVPGTTSRVTQNLQEVTLGLNYHLGAGFGATWPASGPSGNMSFKAPPAPAWAPGWEVEVGARYWLSYGRFQKDLGCGNCTSGASANFLNSRLTYNSTANSGEAFGRIDTPSKIFVKGFIGAGANSSGHMNDEDWNPFPGVGYSNTISNPVKGPINYGTADVGFAVWSGPTYKVGPFIGYNRFQDNKSAFGCAQIANPASDCVPSLPSSTLVITENDTWNSFRLGSNAEFMPFTNVMVTADVAWLPYVSFTGTDNHVLRSLISPEHGNGQGVQLEVIASYYITPAFSVGVGGRYWAMWTNNSAFTNFGGAGCPCQVLPSKTERDGVFVQASYKFGTPAVVAARD